MRRLAICHAVALAGNLDDLGVVQETVEIGTGTGDIADVQGLAAFVFQVETVYEQVGASGRPGDVLAQVF